MTSEEFVAENWVDRLAPALHKLAEAQESYLPEYYGRSRRLQIVFGEQDSNPPVFPLDDLRNLYAMAYHSNVFGNEKHYEPLSAVLDPVRSILQGIRHRQKDIVQAVARRLTGELGRLGNRGRLTEPVRFAMSIPRNWVSDRTGAWH